MTINKANADNASLYERVILSQCFKPMRIYSTLLARKNAFLSSIFLETFAAPIVAVGFKYNIYCSLL